MNKAVSVLNEMSADERARDLFERREKALRDIASMMHDSEQKGRHEQAIETARKLLKRNRLIDEIIEDTGLTLDEIESLKSTS